MIEEGIKLLESFKQNKISELLERIDTTIFEILYSKHVSAQLLPYFPLYELSVMSDTTVLEPGTIYLREKNGAIAYSVLTPTGEIIKDALVKEIAFPIPFTENLSTLKPLKAAILSALYRRGHLKWAPFNNYALEPDNISQIKKLIDALYYARLTFLDLENSDVRNLKRRVSDLKLLYSRTIDLAYEASYLATHLDVDLKDIFNDEIALLLPRLNQIQRVIENHAPQQNAITQALQPQPLAYKTGQIAGKAVDQLRPLDGDVDYNFLTQFSAVLPSYLDQFSQYIKQYSSQIIATEPKLNKQKLEELQKAALQLLNDLENLKGSRIFVSIKFLNYIHIINNIITLSMSSLEQMGELSESSQDVVRDKLAQLKYTIFPTLFGLVDKIEDNSMLKPGTLSVPLMEKVKRLYQNLLFLPKKVTDFKTKGEELLEIEDSLFIELRLEMTYARIDKANNSLYKIKKAQEHCVQFFNMLSSPQYRGYCLYQLPTEIKNQLISHYKLVRPYMDKLDLDLNRLIINQLNAPQKESWSSFMGKPLRLVTRQLPKDHLSLILAKQRAVQDLITKDENSQLFHINLNKDLIDSVHNKADLILFPYNEKPSIYAVDETIPLHTETHEDKKNRIKKTDFKIIQAAYSRFSQLIKNQVNVDANVYQERLDLNHFDEQLKKECADLYKIFQPYLNLFVSADLKTSTKLFENYLTTFFATKAVEIKEPPPLSLFYTLDKNIQIALSQIHFEWFGPTEQNAIQDAYRRFSELIKTQINKEPHHYENYLLLNHLDKKVKTECFELYKVFQPYFKLMVSTELRECAKSFYLYFDDLINNNYVDVLDAPSTALFLKLDTHVHNFLNNWPDKSKNYYDFSKNRFLNSEESAALYEQRQKDTKLKFKKIEGDLLLQNQEQLTADQSIELSQWYKNKHHKLLVAQHAYMQFIDLLKRELKNNPGFQPNILLLNTLEPDLKDQCRNFYNIFQSYFIAAAPYNLRKEVLQLDKYVVALLSNRQIKAEKIPTLDLFLHLDQPIKEYFADIENKWDAKAKGLKDLAQEKFVLENEASALTIDPTLNKRAHFLLQHKNYSNSIHQFRMTLFAVTDLFNDAMQAELRPHKAYVPFPEMEDSVLKAKSSRPMRAVKELTNNMYQLMDLNPQKSNVPFPEMEDDNQRLTQSNQVRAIKDLFNCLYHLEVIVLELEKLDNKSTKSFYVFCLLQAYAQINEIIKLSKRLAADQQLNFITEDLVAKAQLIYATFMEQTDAYQVGSDQVAFGKKAVQYNPLWYVLDAFYISPKHIRALNNHNYLTVEELSQLQLRAKKATMYIEQIIQNSDSYFKLFLQTPHMLYLYKELTKKLNEFTSTTHDSVLNNLGKMRSVLLLSMLLEADLWENKLGLKPGSFSEPLRKITDEFYKGLVHSLDLDSPNHITLVCEQESLQKRIEQTNQLIGATEENIHTLTNDYQCIEDLYQSYMNYSLFYEKMFHQLLVSDETPQIEIAIKKAEENLRTAYKKALSKLVQLKLEKKVEIAQSLYPEDHKLDQLCNLKLKDYDPHFTEIEAWIKASYHYYLGLNATEQMQIKIAQEKLHDLAKLSSIQKKEQIAFIQDYATETFHKKLTTSCNRHIGLQYADKEYREKLEKYLLFFKKEIIEKSKHNNEIKQNIERLLKQKISLFEKKHYSEFYHLDSIRVALAQFKNYFNYSTLALNKNNSLFESDLTLKAKTPLIDNLETIATNRELSIKERIDQIKTQITDPNFSRIILTHKQTDTFSFAYLKLCILSLFELLHLYTPARKELLNKMHDAVQNPPRISELSKRFGLFTTNSPPADFKPHGCFTREPGLN